MTLPSVSVVVPTYGRRDRLAAVVAAIAADPHVSEIVVVVDGCHDGSYELLKELAEAEPRLNPVWQDNSGDAAARQTGVECACGDVVLLLDDDVLAGPGLATAHARVHAGREGLVLLGYMPTSRPVTRRPGDFATVLYADEYERACAAYDRDASSILTHLWMGNLSVRRTDALRVGLVGPGRLSYHSDQDFGLRCRRAGLVGRFDRSLAATHVHRRELARFARQAWLSGADRRYLLAYHPDLLTPADLFDPLPPPVRVAVGLAAAAGLHRLAVPTLRGCVRGAGRLRRWRAETALARLLRQVELRRGYHGRR
ncbi:MAG: glycosyltransferase family 2 protein [Dactylosporangium sp.]|nr:glycosyltransferase family 2 protein [Dactylosporangium sp.]